MKTFLSSKISTDAIAFIRHLEQLKSYDLNCVKSILFDDLPLSKIFKHKEEELIHFLDRRNPTNINIRYEILNVNANKSAIITSNLSFDHLVELLKINPTQIDAIKRRIKTVEINEPFPIIPATPENINDLKKNLSIFHPN
jgi:hypothetical protein